MEIIYINGKFLSQRITGVQRYAREVLEQFEKNPEFALYSFIVVCPEDATLVEGYSHLQFVKIKKKGYFFEQISLPKYLKKHKAKILLNLCNLAPIRFPGATVIHDLNIIDNKNFYSFLYRTIVKFINKRNIKKYNPIFTVSVFSKNRIQAYYKLKDNKIVTTNCGVKTKQIVQDFSDKFSFSQSKFFLTVGSMNKTKNLEYIIQTAKNNPQQTFVITGGMGKVFAGFELEQLDNVICTGYVSDEELTYLYSKCWAFIFPSLYEGFGIPPLEAISAGCRRVILSDIAVFHEIYKDFASYTNPYDFHFLEKNLSSMREITDEEAEELLNMYQWKNVAKIIIDSIKEQL